MITVVIPALDEERNIAAVVTALLAEPVDRVVVVDNGSTDDTAAVARAAGADVVGEPRRGYGFACAAGTRAAFEYGSTIVVYIDADQSSVPSEIGRLLDPLADGRADLVLGSRTLGTVEAGAMGVHQRFGNRLTAAIMRRLYRVDVTDLGPYRAIRADLLRTLEMSEMTFGWPTEMMVKSARRKARIVEVPVSWRTRTAGRSKVSGTVKGTVLAGYFLLSVTVKHAFGPNPDPYTRPDEYCLPMGLGDEKYVLLTTFRKVGTPVPSPVWIVGLDDGRVGFTTSSGSGKVKRLAHTSRVTLQPCDGRGKVKAGTEAVEGTAELVSGAEFDEISRQVKAKYGFMTQLTKALAAIGGIVKRNRMPYADQGVAITLTE